MGPTRNELQLGAGQTMESFWSAQLTWELHKVLEDDDSSSKPDTGRVRRVMRHSETTQVSDPFLILNIFPDFIPFPVSITFRCNRLSGLVSQNTRDSKAWFVLDVVLEIEQRICLSGSLIGRVY